MPDPIAASNDGYVDLGLRAADPDADTVALRRALTGPKVVVTNAIPTMDERRTFTHLKDTGLPDGVLGIGQQVKEVDSYTPDLLGGTREDTDTSMDGVQPRSVRVKVENYFGWMENSMFTVRRVTAQDVTTQGVEGNPYDWVSGPATGTPGAATVRAHFGMASGTPTGHRPIERAVDNPRMTDPGRWTGTMIGVGSIQGERYRGRAEVKVNFDDNDVTTKFDQIFLATDSRADRTANAGLGGHVVNELRDDGITFTSNSIARDGSYTSALTGGVADANKISSLTARFYGPDADEVAGTFNAHGLAFGP